MHPRIIRRQKSMEVCRWCLIRLRPRSRDNIPKLLKMKLLCKYQWGSFLDNQDGWRIAYKRRRTTLRHVARQSRRNLSLHLQWTPTRQPRINKHQERLMEREYAIVRILISKIGWCKEKLKAREWSCSMDLKPWVFADSVEWHKGPSVGEEGRFFYSRYNPALLPPRLPSLWHAGLQSLCSILLCFYKFEYVYKFYIWNQI